ALVQLAVTIFYLRSSVTSISVDGAVTVVHNISAIFVLSALVQATVLIVGLIRFRYVYSVEVKFIRLITSIVIFGIINVLLTGIFGAVVLSMGLLSFAVVNIVTGIAIIYCAAMDVLLSICFLNALIKGLNMATIATRELISSRDAKRLGVTAIMSALFGITQMASGILQATDPSNANVYKDRTDWSLYIPGWLYIYELNTFIYMSYSTAKSIVQNHSIRTTIMKTANNQPSRSVLRYSPSADDIASASNPSETMNRDFSEVGISSDTSFTRIPKEELKIGGREAQS
ncbi:hypothetical protein HK096_000776, partial [Nowakowskiella sp. JEL0078]